MKTETIKVILATALCLGVLTVGFFTVNNLSLAAATEGVESIETTPPVAEIQTTSETPVASETSEVFEENQVSEMTFDVVFNPLGATPSANALSAEAAAEIGAQYIWDMFGICIDGQTITMFYGGQHPSQTRSIWGGSIGRTYFYDGDYQFIIEDENSITFSIDSITGERISIYRHVAFPELSEDVRAALEEFFNNRESRAIEEMIALRMGAPVEYGAFIEAVKEHAGRHFVSTEIVSVEFMGANAITYNLDENGNLYITDRQLTFEVTDSTGRVADIAMVEATKELIWLDTSANDVIPGFSYMGATPGLG